MPYVEANGTSLHYELAGHGGQILVLIHELGGSLRSWDEIVPAFAASHRVLRYDMRGHGSSEKIRAPYSARDAAADLAGLLDAFGIGRPVTIAGCAVGACVGLQFAATYPERMQSLIAMAPSTGIGEQARPWVLKWADEIERDGMRRFVDEEMAPNAYPPVLRTDQERFARFRGQQISNDPASFAATYRMLVDCDIGNHLNAVTCPTLLVAGTHDVPRSPAFVSTLVGAFPDARMVVIDSGHFMMVQTPHLVVDAISGFLIAQQERG
ncbi:alpha/beta fold hydrolase [Microvirga alba]|uniref:Alpha/beta fold hydrolase n=1 Tax=Microvirga alba TaxID=2791025 RepID=A0A931FQU8_9HYPH|nr:alpha/beta fold hydrolase [Microvirga alba]MBF9233858.1 alpha/beta fold hydrolase [Microvirga alba]